MAIAMHAKDPNRFKPIADVSGPIKSFDHEKGEFVEVEKEKTEQDDTLEIEEKALENTEITIDLDMMDKNEIDSFIEKTYGVKIDLRKFRNIDKLKAEAQKIIDKNK